MSLRCLLRPLLRHLLVSKSKPQTLSNHWLSELSPDVTSIPFRDLICPPRHLILWVSSNGLGILQGSHSWHLWFAKGKILQDTGVRISPETLTWTERIYINGCRRRKMALKFLTKRFLERMITLFFNSKAVVIYVSCLALLKRQITTIIPSSSVLVKHNAPLSGQVKHYSISKDEDTW